MCHDSMASGLSYVFLDAYAGESSMPENGAADCTCDLTIDTTEGVTER